MKTHYICQNSMTGAIHVLEYKWSLDYITIRLTPCGYYCSSFERNGRINLNKKRTKICSKCHNSLSRTHNKNLMAFMAYIKLTGEINGRLKI